MTARAAFKQADIERAIKGVLAAGLTVHSVEITPEGIAINISELDRPKRKNPLDRLHGRHENLADKLYGSRDD